jgi:hypothetical protein
MVNVPKNANANNGASVGGRRRKTIKKMKGGRKGTRKFSKWTAFVKKIYSEMKKKNKNVKLGDAMKAASKRKSEM